jgi:hypothetical protein
MVVILPQLSLARLLAHGDDIVPIPGMPNPKRLEGNLRPRRSR